MAKKNRNIVWSLLGALGLYMATRTTKKNTPTTTARTGTINPSLMGGGGGAAVYNPPVTGFIITGVGQTVTGLTVPQTVTLPARVINLQATPSGIYSGTVTLKTTGGTVLHTETITDLNISSTGYPAIYFNPQNPVWNIPGAGTYVMQIVFSIQGNNYTRSVEIPLTNTDLGIVEGGTTGISIIDYAINNGNEVVLSLTGGTVGESVTIQLKQGTTVVGTLTAVYSASMTVTSSVYGYCDVVVNNTDLGGVYVPYQITGTWAVQKAKADGETATLDLQFNKVGNAYIITDSNSNSGWANVEYWHNATFLGASIPNNYAVEPNIIHHLTKKRWGAGAWIGYDGDGVNKQKAQLTFKIVSA